MKTTVAKPVEIEQFDPCSEGLAFRRQFKTFCEAWNACPRGDWMLWIASRIGVDIRLLTLAKAKCARTVQHLMKDPSSLKALDVAEQFGLGKASFEELAEARRNAAAYAYAYAAAYAAYAAAYAYAYAAAYAAYAAADAYADAAKKENQKKTADICREILTEAVFAILEQSDN